MLAALFRGRSGVVRVSLLTAGVIRRKRAAHSTLAGQFGRRAKVLVHPDVLPLAIPAGFDEQTR